MSRPIKQDDLNGVENEDSDGLSLIEEEGYLKYGGSKNVSQFRLIPENEETVGWSSSDSERSDLENGEYFESTEIDSHFQTPSEGEDNPSSEIEDIVEKPNDMNLSNA